MMTTTTAIIIIAIITVISKALARVIQIHGNTIFPMRFNPIIKAHDSNLWQIIHQKAQFHWKYQKPNFHRQYPKPSFHWQYPKPNFHWHYFIKKPKIINIWQRKNIMV